MLLDRAWIASRIPHQGTMCLLDSVEKWDDESVVCRAVSHRLADNPLRAHDRLSSICGIEYAAQAMAVHGALTSSRNDAPSLGYLASVRGIRRHAERLDDVGTDLIVTARRFSGDGNNVIYDFSIHSEERVLIEGRAAVIIDA